MKKCIKEPIEDILVAAGLLRQAVDSHKAGQKGLAAAYFRAADMPSVRAWTESIWRKGWSQLISPMQIQGAPPYIAVKDRVPLRMPTKSERAGIIRRDGYHCRFCGIPVIRKEVRVHASQLYPDAVSWGNTNLTQHAAFQCMWLQFDHLLPHSRGGGNDLDNILITCAPCNYGRFHYTVEELEISDPFKRPVESSNWKGLEDFLIDAH